MSKKLKLIDLFAGCGGLTEGFMQTNKYIDVASVEWLDAQVKTLRNRLIKKWSLIGANDNVMRFDIQRENELFSGWNDEEYGVGKGLDFFVKKNNGIDIIIGGPPCQAYSVAGRVRDENGMTKDYRNYLFEHYLSVVSRYKPKLFVFENVPGLLSAKPNERLITDIIREAFNKIGYEIYKDLRQAVVNACDYGVPQNRNRVIIVGLKKDCFDNIQTKLNTFYNKILPRYKSKIVYTVKDAIGDLPKCMPIVDENVRKRTHKSHLTPKCDVTWHVPRYSNLRDMDTFRILAEDIYSGRREYDSKRISELYEKKIGAKSPIHRYHVLEPDTPSTTIIAHLYKDGNRFIHYDPQQQRTITVREAARLQSFPDDFEFLGTQGNAYQMIGNAVPPMLAKAIAEAIYIIFKEAKRDV